MAVGSWDLEISGGLSPKKKKKIKKELMPNAPLVLSYKIPAEMEPRTVKKGLLEEVAQEFVDTYACA
jgi:hypothetical protein